MISRMEQNKHILINAIKRLPEFGPDDKLWDSIQQKLQEGRLNEALQNLPVYAPSELTWENISANLPRKRVSMSWWYAASVALIVSLAAWMYENELDKQIQFSQEMADIRLQAGEQPETDLAYQKLQAYCQTETLVCERQDYRRLKDEYEKLHLASEQLFHAIGNYNTEPALVRQFNEVERQKAAVLNEMAKMI
jgi:phosphoglycerate-specific signal transduction histidine kinase